MRIIDDRLAQYRRILVKSAQPDPAPGDNIIRVPPEILGTLDLSQPLVRGGSTAAGPLGTATDPVADSFSIMDPMATNGAAGLDSRGLVFASAGLWHLHIASDGMFIGTNNTAGQSLLQLQGGINPLLGTPAFQANLEYLHFLTGNIKHRASDFWLPMLDAWNLVRITTARVAGDLFVENYSVIGRRFL